MVKSLMLILLVVLALPVLAQEVALKGERTDEGYKIYFSENKESFVKLFGFSEIWLSEKGRDKVEIPYFRFYIDGQTNKKWSFHTRLDYNESWFAKTSNTSSDFDDAKATTVSGLYAARAYMTYTYNEMFSIDYGRILNMPSVNHDVLASVAYSVDLGTALKFNYKNLTLNGTVTYTDNAAQTEDVAYVGTYASYLIKLQNDRSIKLASGFYTPEKSKDTANKYYQITPSIDFTTPSFYIFDQFGHKYDEHNKHYMVQENYIELGTSVLGKYCPDIYLLSTKTRNVKMTHEVGLENMYKFSPEFYTVLVLSYYNINRVNDGADLKGRKEFRPKLKLNYTF